MAKDPKVEQPAPLIECVGLVRTKDGVSVVRVMASEAQVVERTAPDLLAVAKGHAMTRLVRLWEAL